MSADHAAKSVRRPCGPASKRSKGRGRQNHRGVARRIGRYASRHVAPIAVDQCSRLFGIARVEIDGAEESYKRLVGSTEIAHTVVRQAEGGRPGVLTRNDEGLFRGEGQRFWSFDRGGAGVRRGGI